MAALIISILLAFFSLTHQIYDAAFVFLFTAVVFLYILPATMGVSKQKEKAQGETLSPLGLLEVPLVVLEGGLKLIIGAFDALFGGGVKDKRDKD